jgi:hypothetical protein
MFVALKEVRLFLDASKFVPHRKHEGCLILRTVPGVLSRSLTSSQRRGLECVVFNFQVPCLQLIMLSASGPVSHVVFSQTKWRRCCNLNGSAVALPVSVLNSKLTAKPCAVVRPSTCLVFWPGYTSFSRSVWGVRPTDSWSLIAVSNNTAAWELTLAFRYILIALVPDQE